MDLQLQRMDRRTRLTSEMLKRKSTNDIVKLPLLSEPKERDPWKRAAEMEKKLQFLMNQQSVEMNIARDELESWKSKYMVVCDDKLSQESELRRSRMMLIQLRQDIEQSKENTKNLRDKISRVETHLASKDHHISQLQHQLEQQQQQQQLQLEQAQPERQSDSSIEEQERNDLRREIARMESQIERIRAEGTVNLLKTKADSTRQLKREQAVRVEMETLVDKLKTKSHYDSKEIRLKNKENADLSHKNDELKSLYESSNEEAKKWIEQAKEMQHQRDLAREAFEAAENEKKQLQQLVDENQQMILNLNKNLTAIQDAYEKVKDELAEKEEEIQGLNAQLQQQQAEEPTEEPQDDDVIALESELQESITDVLRTENLCFQTKIHKLQAQVAEYELKLKRQELQHERTSRKITEQLQQRIMELEKEKHRLSAIETKRTQSVEAMKSAHRAYHEEQEAKKALNNIENLLRTACANDSSTDCSRYKLMLEACQQENALLRFSSAAAETQVRKYDAIAAENITQNRRAQIKKVHDQVKASQQDLEQRARDASLVNTERLRAMLDESKIKYEAKRKHSETAFQQVLEAI